MARQSDFSRFKLTFPVAKQAAMLPQSHTSSLSVTPFPQRSCTTAFTGRCLFTSSLKLPLFFNTVLVFKPFH